MHFRPCIDIHNGKVKQIVGGSLTDEQDRAIENYVAREDASFFAELYRKDGLRGGHVILLNAKESPYYKETKRQALCALRAYPGGLMAGGGIDPGNAEEFLTAGASHVIVTSYVFRDGRIDYEHLRELVSVTGRDRLVLDLSCRRRDGDYVVVTDRWQKFTEEIVDEELLERLAPYTDELLIHAVDVEGKAKGIEGDLARLLAGWGQKPITYAGGVGSMSDLEELERIAEGRLDVTVGSALDLFGGSLSYREICRRWR